MLSVDADSGFGRFGLPCPSLHVPFGSVLIRSRTQESNSNGPADFAIDVRDCLGFGFGEEFKLKLSNIVQLQIGKVR